MERRPVESEALVSVGYDPATSTLEIEFRRGRVYAYEEVPASLYEWLLRVPDKGGLFQRLIRDKYPTRDVTPVAEQDLLDVLKRSLEQAPED